MLSDMLIRGRLLFSICICLVISTCVDYILIVVGVTRFGITTVVRGSFSRFSDYCGLLLAIKGILLRSSEVVLHRILHYMLFQRLFRQLYGFYSLFYVV